MFRVRWQDGKFDPGLKLHNTHVCVLRWSLVAFVFPTSLTLYVFTIVDSMSTLLRATKMALIEFRTHSHKVMRNAYPPEWEFNEYCAFQTIPKNETKTYFHIRYVLLFWASYSQQRRWVLAKYLFGKCQRCWGRMKYARIYDSIVWKRDWRCHASIERIKIAFYIHI